MSELEERFKMEDRSTSYLRHYPSTPHLDSFTSGVGAGSSSTNPLSSHHSFHHHTLSGASSNVNLMSNSYMPKSNFSTFMQQKKPVPPPKTSSLSCSINGGIKKAGYQDDPNPYKVSRIDEYRIKVNDPFLPNKSPASHRSNQSFSFYSQATNGDNEDEELCGNLEAEDVRAAFGQLVMNSGKGRGLSEDEGDASSQHHPLSSYNGSAKVHRSGTLKSTSSDCRRVHHRRSESASVSASSTSTGEIEIDGEFILPDPDYEGFHHHHHHHHAHHRVAPGVGEECERTGNGSGINIPGPISDSSCTSSEGYSSVSAATSCSASEPDPYAVPNTGRSSSSPDEGSILEANDSGIETPTRITEKDRIKIEYALMGRKTSIFVADCLANLYCMRRSNFVSRPNSSLSNHNGSYSGQSSSSTSGDGEWVLKYTGVPVLLLDLGETKSRDKRRIQIVLAELGSGLALWKDVIDNLSSYKVMEGSHTFHIMHLSTDHTKLIGLSFDDEECAESFYQRVDKLTSDFKNISLSGSKSKSKSKKDKGSAKAAVKTKFVKPKKCEISQPCGFNHISSLTSIDRKRFPSLQNFLAGSGNNGPTNAAGSPNGVSIKSGEHSSAASSSSHEDFVSMSPLALADTHGSDLHF